MNNFTNIRKKLGSFFPFSWYPILFGAYPVLALLSFNIGQVKFEAGWRPLLVSTAFAGMLFGLLRWLMRDAQRAAFLSTLWLALFFSYGHVCILLTEKWTKFHFKPWLLLAWFVLAVVAMMWARRTAPSAVGLNAIAFGLVVTSLVQISSGLGPRSVHALAAEHAPVKTLVRPPNPPDIYYFILDSYAREDLLKSAYGYDNSDFVKALQERGFYVAQCSQSNYSRTELSVASSLNMAYLQGLDSQFVPDNTGRLRLWDAFKHSAVRYSLEQMGYQTISYATGYAWSELDDVDVFLTPPPFSSGMTEFETLFLQTTLARHLNDLGWMDADQIMGQNYRDRHMLVFNSMKDVAKMKGPKFVYVHLLLPHPPFVFGPDGKYTNPADFWNEEKIYPVDRYEAGYKNQLTFLNRNLLDTMNTILFESAIPPIIILQGDHGPWIQPNPQHFWILNAYYLPGHAEELYPTISPVNTFRLIFNAYFSGKYDLLKDETYYSPVPKLYDFSQVAYPCNH